jgi:hypothetical protein
MSSAQMVALQSELSSKQKELDRTKLQLDSSIGREIAINLANNFGLSDVAKTMPETFVIVTAAPGNEELGREIENIFNQARGISGAKNRLLPTGLPNYEKDLDAPRLEGSGERGITIHGRNQAGDFLMQVFSNNGCFITHQTGDTPEVILEYIHRIYHHVAYITNITWVEIGNGPAWKTPGCLNH